MTTLLINVFDVVARMSSGIYHATSIERYREIRNKGQILPGGQVEHRNFPQSECSNSRDLGAVACFDFERADRSKLFGADAMMKWPGVLFSRRFSEVPTTVAVGFDRCRLPRQPLYYPEIKKSLGYGGIIPYGIECCYPGPMELALAGHIVLVCHWNETVLEVETQEGHFITDETLDLIGRRHKELVEECRSAL